MKVSDLPKEHPLRKAHSHLMALGGVLGTMEGLEPRDAKYQSRMASAIQDADARRAAAAASIIEHVGNLSRDERTDPSPPVSGDADSPKSAAVQARESDIAARDQISKTLVRPSNRRLSATSLGS